MHFVTKFFVVCAAVLSLFLSALVIAYSVNADRITADYQAESQRRIAMEASTQDQAGRHGLELARMKEQLSALERDLLDRSTKLNELEAANATLQTDKAKAEARVTTFDSRIAQLTETLTLQTTLATKLRDEVAASRKGELTFRTQSLQMEDRISDLESQNEVLGQTVRALQEQLAEARLAIDQGKTGVAAATGGTSEPFTFTGPLISGRVEKVTRDPSTGNLLAQINLGANDQIRQNMKLFIGRGTEFIGNLVVVSTDLKTAVGKVDLLGRTVDVREGDTVVSRLQ